MASFVVSHPLNTLPSSAVIPLTHLVFQAVYCRPAHPLLRFGLHRSRYRSFGHFLLQVDQPWRPPISMDVQPDNSVAPRSSGLLVRGIGVGCGQDTSGEKATVCVATRPRPHLLRFSSRSLCLCSALHLNVSFCQLETATAVALFYSWRSITEGQSRSFLTTKLQNELCSPSPTTHICRLLGRE
jgi:hypothetical protein